MAFHYYHWRHGQVHYEKHGMGEAMVLLHNLYPGASREEFERNVGELARHFTVYAVDLLGFGASDAPGMKYTAKTYIELIEGFLKEEVGRPAHVVAAGLTCAYVSELAARKANLFNRLVFICPRSEPTGLDSPRWFAPIRRWFLSTPGLSSGSYAMQTSETEIRRFLCNSLFSSRAVTNELVRRLAENARQKGSIYAYASLLTGYLDCSILASLPRVEVPVMLIWGRQARPTPVEHSVRLVAVTRKCLLHVVEDAGAWVHVEQSAKANAAIVEYCLGKAKQ